MVVLQFADYSAPYDGNFISSLRHLMNEVEALGGKMLFLFPERTKDCSWVASLKREYSNVFFLSRSSLYNIFLLRRLINRYKIDIIHSHFSVFKYDFIIKAARLLSRKTVYIRHMHMIYRNKSSKIIELFKRSISCADCEIACSKPVYDSMRQAGLKRLVTVVNAIDFNRLARFEELKREDYSDEPEDALILMFGYNYLVKGVDVAISAVKQLNQNGFKSTLLICAAVNSDAIRIEITREHGEVPSFVRIIPPRTDIASYYRLCEIFLSASRTESFCYALREAGYCGALLVASDIDAHKGISEAELFKSEDSRDLCEKLKSVILLGNKAERIQSQIKSIEKSYSISEWCRDLISIYKKVLTK